jgi:hypothetical protein
VRNESLLHSLRVSGVRILVVGWECMDAVASAQVAIARDLGITIYAYPYSSRHIVPSWAVDFKHAINSYHSIHLTCFRCMLVDVCCMHVW